MTQGALALEPLTEAPAEPPTEPPTEALIEPPTGSPTASPTEPSTVPPTEPQGMYICWSSYASLEPRGYVDRRGWIKRLD